MIVQTTASALRIRSLPLIAQGTDTGKRLLPTQKAVAYGEDFDFRWKYIVAPQGSGWASAAYLEEVWPPPFRTTNDAKWITRPHGLSEIREVFGPECSPSASAGVCKLPAPLRLAWGDRTPIRQFHCHIYMVPIFESFFFEISHRGLWSLLDDEWGGCYNCRNKTGTTTKKSTHSWGIAIDVAVSRNQFGRKPTLDPRIVAIAKDHQLIWGGDWSKPDGMHFQYATGY